jgi:hypothetical protein
LTDFLEELSERRQRWLTANRENDFEEGILNLLTRLYPDQAHFIFELLQNAEDAGATAVRFELARDLLRFSHDGRSFTRSDVSDITGIGTTDKRDDQSQIGEFGVGFKSVFSYSASPRIYSGEFSFEIRDLVCPRALDPVTPPSDRTVFEFPLNATGKRSKRAFEEIEQELSTLDPRTLLFLTNIQSITWSAEGVPESTLAREEHPTPGGRLISILRSTPGARPVQSLWLRYWKQSELGDDLRVAVAFALDKLDKRRRIDAKAPLEAQVKVIPVEGGLSIFFPATKESTKLKFQIHGPFAATVARDSIVTSEPDNLTLLGECAELTAEALEDIRELGLLTAGALAVLPNERDELAEPYEPFLERVLGAVQTLPLLPREAGGHAVADELVYGPRAIREVVPDSLLPFLYSQGDPEATTPAWMAGGGGTRVTQFLQAAGVEEWGWEELIDSGMVAFNGDEDSEERLSGQSAEWMQRFYALLWEAGQRNDDSYYFSPRLYHVLRLSDHTHAEGGRSSAAVDRAIYLPDDPPAPFDLRTISTDVIPEETSPFHKKVLAFLKEAGVRKIGENERIHAILNQFYTDGYPDPTTEEHLEHMQAFLSWWKRDENLRLFRDYYLFHGPEREALYKASDLCIDLPYKDTGLGTLYRDLEPDDPDRVTLWNGYEGQVRSIVEFAVALGATDALSIIQRQVWQHADWDSFFSRGTGRRETHTGINKDWTVDNLATLLSRQVLGISSVVWRTMCEARAEVLQAMYRANREYRTKTKESTLILLLREYAWIPDLDGEFFTPAKLTQARLHPSLIPDNSNGWLDAIGLGEDAEGELAQGEAREARTEAAKLLGFSPSALERFDDALLRLSPEERTVFFDEIMDQALLKANQGFPERESANPERRAAKVTDRARDAEGRRYSVRERSVRVSGQNDRKAGKTYLLDQYTNEDGAMICQVCTKEMPFRLGNGSPYFEAVEALPLEKEHRENLVALCPTCAAKYRHANTTDLEEMRREFIEYDGAWAPLELAGDEETLTFTQVHFDDLRAVVDSETE